MWRYIRGIESVIDTGGWDRRVGIHCDDQRKVKLDAFLDVKIYRNDVYKVELYYGWRNMILPPTRFAL